MSGGVCSSASFGDHVLRVVLRGTEEEVIGSDALAVVAAVADVQAVRDRAVRVDPRESVCGVQYFVTSNSPVPLPVECAGPPPTLGGLQDVVPEAHCVTRFALERQWMCSPPHDLVARRAQFVGECWSVWVASACLHGVTLLHKRTT